MDQASRARAYHLLIDTINLTKMCHYLKLINNYRHLFDTEDLHLSHIRAKVHWGIKKQSLYYKHKIYLVKVRLMASKIVLVLQDPKL